MFSNGIDCIDHEAITEECKLVGSEEVAVDIISIYPKPAQGNVTLAGVHGIVDLRIHNSLGQLVFKQIGINKQIDIQLPQASGIYSLTAKGDGIHEVQRIIKH